MKFIYLRAAILALLLAPLNANTLAKDKLADGTVIPKDIESLLDAIDNWAEKQLGLDIYRVRKDGSTYFISVIRDDAAGALRDKIREKIGVALKADAHAGLGYGVFITEPQVKQLAQKLGAPAATPVSQGAEAEKLLGALGDMINSRFPNLAFEKLPNNKDFRLLFPLENTARDFSKYLFGIGIKGGKNKPNPTEKFVSQKLPDKRWGVILEDSEVIDLNHKLIKNPVAKPGQPPAASPATKGSALAQYRALDPKSNEAVLIQRAAAYAVSGIKEDAFFKLSTAAINGYVEQALSSENFKGIFSMMEKMLPVHRCSMDTLLGIDKIGYLLSLEILGIGNIANQNDETISPLLKLLKFSHNRNDLNDIIKLAVIEFMIKTYRDDPSGNIDANFTSPSSCVKLKSNSLPAFDKCAVALKAVINNNAEATKLQSHITSVLNIKAGGLAYSKDKALGTDKFVFSVLGINHGSQYGWIILPLDANLLASDNSWSTPLAATYFYKMSHEIGPIWYGAASGRVWVKSELWPQSRTAFEKSKIYKNKALVAAAEMLGRVFAYYGDNKDLDPKFKNSLQAPMAKLPAVKGHKDVSVKHVRSYMENIDSHALMEVHITPTSNKDIFKIVTDEAIKDTFINNISQGFKNKLVTVPQKDQIQSKAESFSAPQGH